MTTLASKVSISEQVTYNEVGGEIVLLNLESGKYYGLDEIGARMFTLLHDKGKLEIVYAMLLEEYKVDAERLKKDLIELVDELARNDLVKVSED
jgi:hypothetical protein